MSLKAILDSIVISDEEHAAFVRDCSEWGHYNIKIIKYDKVKVLKLIKYLVEERPSGNNLLTRAISRFNKLNALKKEHLL